MGIEQSEAPSETIVEPRRVGVEFGGQAGEYFKIWIVNTALTIVTLGIYSAWAKVRKLRYFYGQSSIEDGHFDYHANPVAILKGRVIAVAILLAYLLASQYQPLIGLAIFVIVLLAVPWLVVRAKIFQLRNTSYQGLRFNFRRNYGDSFSAFYGGALIAVVSLGFAAPTAIYMRNKFVAENAGFGTTVCSWKGRQGPFYGIFWASVGLALLAFILYSFLMLPLQAALLPPIDPDGRIPQQSVFLFIVVQWLTVLPIFLIYGAAGVYVKVRQKNYVWNQLWLNNNSFESSLSVRTMCWLYLSNIIAIVASLGLLTPWAQIRLARYRASCMHLNLRDKWENYRVSKDAEGSAFGEEVGEAFDVGIDFAI